jgi:hypothetical protein
LFLLIREACPAKRASRIRFQRFSKWKLGVLLNELDAKLNAGEVDPSQAISDVLVFEAPADNAKTLRLTLPGGAYGGSGELHLKIPAYTIQR